MAFLPYRTLLILVLCSYRTACVLWNEWMNEWTVASVPLDHINSIQFRGSHVVPAISAVHLTIIWSLGVCQQHPMKLKEGYLMNAGQTVDDTEHYDSIAMRIVSYLNGHSIEQHLIESISEQRLRQLAEKVLQHACNTDIVQQSALELSFNRMRYINPRFTYLLIF